MYSRSLFTLLATVLALNGFASTATATLPDDRRISFTIRETPTDPESDVRYHVILDLEAVDTDHAFVAWDITQIEFVEPDAGGDIVWVDNTLDVDTSDGLWWVEHSDPEAPELDEFLITPFLTGTATTVAQGEPDLEYEFQGVTHTPLAPPGTAPYELTAALDWDFIRDTTEEEGEDEPVEPTHVDDPD